MIHGLNNNLKHNKPQLHNKHNRYNNKLLLNKLKILMMFGDSQQVKCQIHGHKINNRSNSHNNKYNSHNKIMIINNQSSKHNQQKMNMVLI